MLHRLIMLGLACLISFLAVPVQANQMSMEEIGQKAVTIACERLNITSGSEHIACLTNAGYAAVAGKRTRTLFDILPKLANISIGRGNLLTVHDAYDAPLWLAFVKKQPDRQLMLVLLRMAGQKLEASKAINIFVDKETSFVPFQEVLGRKAFALVTLANGWADGLPEELMVGSLFHDHLCCGVFSGYHTANYIRQHIPLVAGETYIYVGTPAWCQDDYLISTMNLTPGKHGYYTMAYPWYRPWKTAEKTYDQLGGIVIRYDNAAENGWAYLLRFDWHWDEFKDYLQMPDAALEWKKSPWLHVCYNRFSMKYVENPDHFLSVVKRIKLASRSDLARLVNMGSNPLEEMLGSDPDWH